MKIITVTIEDEERGETLHSERYVVASLYAHQLDAGEISASDFLNLSMVSSREPASP